MAPSAERVLDLTLEYVLQAELDTRGFTDAVVSLPTVAEFKSGSGGANSTVFGEFNCEFRAELCSLSP